MHTICKSLPLSSGAVLGLALLCAGVSCDSLAAAKMYTGAANGDFNTAGNWTPSGVPGSTDDVTIGVNVVVSGSVSIQSLALTGGTLSNSGGAVLTVTGDTATSSGSRITGNIVLGTSLTVTSGPFYLGQFGQITFGQSTTINGNVSLEVLSTVTINSGAVVTINGNLLCFGDSASNTIGGAGSLSVNGGFTVNDACNMNVSLTASASTTTLVTPSANGQGTLTFGNGTTATFNGPVSVQGSGGNHFNLGATATVNFNNTVALSNSHLTGTGGSSMANVNATSTLTSDRPLSATSNVSAVLNVLGTVTVNSGSLEVRGGGTLTGTINGTGGKFRMSSNLGEAFILSGAAALSGAIEIVGGPFTINKALTYTGSMTLNGQGGNLAGSGSLTVNGPFTVSSGGSGSTSTLPSIVIPSGQTLAFPANGTLSLSSSAMLTCNGSMTMAQNSRLTINTGSTATFSGTVTIDRISGIAGDGTFALTSTASLTSTHATGSNQISCDTTNAGTIVSQQGTLDFGAFGGTYTQTGGSLTLNGGNVAGPLVLNGGTLRGVGTITGNVTNGATVSPGLSPGLLAITGNFTQTASGTLNIEIGGTLPADFDRLTISANANLNGSLSVTLTNGYSPQTGDSLTPVTFNTRTNSFATTNVNGANLSVNVGTTGVTVSSTASNPVPTITTLSPSTVKVNNGDFGLVVAGTGFGTGTLVRINGSDRPTLVLSATQVLALLPNTDTATAGSANITVFNPTPGGGSSPAAVLTVSASAGGGGGPETLPGQTDTDGDGFSDAIETVAGASPINAADTPLGSAQAGSPIPFADAKLAIKLNFSKPASDSISLSGVLVLAEGVELANQTLLVNIGDVAQKFTLDSAGVSKSATGSVSLKSKGRLARTAKLTLKLGKSDLAEGLASSGLTNETRTANVNVPITVIIGSAIYQRVQKQSYKGLADKAGASKDLKE